MLRALVDGNADPSRSLGPTTVRGVHAKERAVESEAASAHHAQVGGRRRPPQASRPKVRLWQREEFGTFLDYAAGDRLGALYELVATTGLRHGEVCGLRWIDVDLERGALWVRQQVVQLGHALHVGPPKSESGEDRRVDLDEHAIGTLLAHRLNQDAERARGRRVDQLGPLVHARERVGLAPETLTKRFRR
jgi:integrase